MQNKNINTKKYCQNHESYYTNIKADNGKQTEMIPIERPGMHLNKSAFLYISIAQCLKYWANEPQMVGWFLPGAFVHTCIISENLLKTIINEY